MHVLHFLILRQDVVALDNSLFIFFNLFSIRVKVESIKMFAIEAVENTRKDQKLSF